MLQHDVKAATPAASRLKQSHFTLQYLILVKFTDIYLQSAEIIWRSSNFFKKDICILLFFMA